jgi:hypothetical protein
MLKSHNMESIKNKPKSLKDKIAQAAQSGDVAQLTSALQEANEALTGMPQGHFVQSESGRESLAREVEHFLNGVKRDIF